MNPWEETDCNKMTGDTLKYYTRLRAVLREIPQKSVFVETGSYVGNGIEPALAQGFKNIISIELTDKYASFCRSRFAQNNNVHIIQGDSSTHL